MASTIHWCFITLSKRNFPCRLTLKMLTSKEKENFFYCSLTRIRKCWNIIDQWSTYAVGSSQEAKRIGRWRTGIFRSVHEDIHVHGHFSKIQKQGNYYSGSNVSFDIFMADCVLDDKSNIFSFTVFWTKRNFTNSNWQHWVICVRKHPKKLKRWFLHLKAALKMKNYDKYLTTLAPNAVYNIKSKFHFNAAVILFHLIVWNEQWINWP